MNLSTDMIIYTLFIWIGANVLILVLAAVKYADLLNVAEESALAAADAADALEIAIATGGNSQFGKTSVGQRFNERT